ncbi:Protein of unknown function [Bacillus mycoides]|uniref:Uncharacterized protein n=1 Tax=Bacillus mycoides TaxID=1405 RepID=A0A1G4EXJ7_BACMY|nr:Protein of unknown function [Bacillus mycoides]
MTDKKLYFLSAGRCHVRSLFG